ncbi:MAG: UDP-N-acetylmuramoyl-L-alanine--D-glutamate ligase [Candidatus Peribacteraceae bacterium]
MHIRDLAGKSVCILGYGLEGKAIAEALEKYAPGCRITVADKNYELRITNYESRLGTNYLDDLDRFDVIIKSPGIPPDALLTTHYKLLTSPTQIFLDSVADTGSMVIGVTGSKGKSTTASLIHAILKKAGKDTYLIGNIGTPTISFIERSKPNTIFVQEMSSYQLMDLNKSPQIAVLTAFFPEHLDYHGSVEAYLEAKKHIARFQKPDDRVFFNGESEECRSIADESKGRKIPFTAKNAPVRIDQTKLLGRHNLSNIASAFKVASFLRVPNQIAIEAICEFQGLPHRLESIGIHDGIEWVDDSISTNPQSAIEALNALGDRVTTIILGGQDRGFDFTPLAKRIAGSKVQTVILLPDSGTTIRKAIEKTGANVKCIEVKTMEEAVERMKAIARPPSSPNPFPPWGKGNSAEREQCTHVPVQRTILKFARLMRKQPTKAEELLWEKLRNNGIGKKFRRQHPFQSRILDFYCDECRLGIEIDGSVHDNNEQRQYDHEREKALGEYGIQILRFTNEEVLNDIEKIINQIKSKCTSPLPAGEGQGVREVPIVLLSPASPSYGHFKNFEDRGEQFKNVALK